VQFQKFTELYFEGRLEMLNFKKVVESEEVMAQLLFFCHREGSDLSFKNRPLIPNLGISFDREMAF
jgi:hypothetical protein